MSLGYFCQSKLAPRWAWHEHCHCSSGLGCTLLCQNSSCCISSASWDWWRVLISRFYPRCIWVKDKEQIIKPSGSLWSQTCWRLMIWSSVFICIVFPPRYSIAWWFHIPFVAFIIFLFLFRIEVTLWQFSLIHLARLFTNLLKLRTLSLSTSRGAHRGPSVSDA